MERLTWTKEDYGKKNLAIEDYRKTYLANGRLESLTWKIEDYKNLPGQ